jgi:hypothetical protein
MKAILHCQAGDITKLTKDPYTINLSLDAKGQVQEHGAFGKEVVLIGTLQLKPVVAEQLQIGQHFQITIETTE